MSGLVFFGSLATIAYAYLGFPLLLWLRSRLASHPYRVADHEPTVSLIVCAHNEAAAIGAKLENLCALDYPSDRLELIVASDGSSDGTEDRVRAYADRVRLLALPRRGKIPTLNAAVAEAQGEILVFSDANSMYARDALRALVRPFAAPEVGGVAGDQRYSGSSRDDEGARGERTYWDLDRRLKQWQSRSGSVTSSTGAIHAVRRGLFAPVPPGVTDDFWISTNVVARGRRLVFADDAVAWEPASSSGDLEFQRKVRIMTRGLHGVWLMRRLLNPLRHGFYAIQLLSHKLLRRLVFLPLAGLLVTSFLLWDAGPLFRLAALSQAAFYGLAALSAALPRGRGGRLVRLLALPGYFCLVNAAAVLASWNVLRGKRIDRWEPRRELPAPTPLPGPAGGSSAP